MDGLIASSSSGDGKPLSRKRLRAQLSAHDGHIEGGEQHRTSAPLLATASPALTHSSPPPPPLPRTLRGAAASSRTPPLPLAPFLQAWRPRRRARTASPARPPWAAGHAHGRPRWAPRARHARTCARPSSPPTSPRSPLLRPRTLFPPLANPVCYFSSRRSRLFFYVLVLKVRTAPAQARQHSGRRAHGQQASPGSPPRHHLAHAHHAHYLSLSLSQLCARARRPPPPPPPSPRCRWAPHRRKTAAKAKAIAEVEALRKADSAAGGERPRKQREHRRAHGQQAQPGGAPPRHHLAHAHHAHHLSLSLSQLCARARRPPPPPPPSPRCRWAPHLPPRRPPRPRPLPS